MYLPIKDLVESRGFYSYGVLNSKNPREPSYIVEHYFIRDSFPGWITIETYYNGTFQDWRSYKE